MMFALLFCHYILYSRALQRCDKGGQQLLMHDKMTRQWVTFLEKSLHTILNDADEMIKP
jgi:hypothetical protein